MLHLLERDCMDCHLSDGGSLSSLRRLATDIMSLLQWMMVMMMTIIMMSVAVHASR